MLNIIFFSVIAILCAVGIILLSVLIGNSKNAKAALLSECLENYEKRFGAYEKNLKDEFERNRKETSEMNIAARKENTENLMAFQNSVNGKLDTLTKNTHESLSLNLTRFMQTLSAQIGTLTKNTQEALNTQQEKVRESLKSIQDSNEKKLEQMRATVDEKLQSTLERRLTGSFELVTKQLEAVQKGLGEMQNLASDVGGLKRALTNVKNAGVMGEVQLEALLTQILSPEQFIKNAHPNPNNPKKVVEFAVKIPSKTSAGEFILLPIDSKYPAEVWDKLSLAYEHADKDEIETQKKALAADIKKMAKDIKEKYIEVPYTTDFGLLFLPFEGLFAEVMRMQGLFQRIQDECKVTIAGPTTLGAFLNSLQMGFRTLAIQKETSKVWELLGTIKSEFGKFGDILAATKKKIEAAHSEIEKAETKTRGIEKKLTKVDVLPPGEKELLADNTQTLLNDMTEADPI
ncbi:MAG: DNA recombination protein RmuC [Bacteroides sp.]|nr:DNA recombination protein RmuC [Prevotella sp.]MCM1408550.1 DNA recombination protein RmuC [Treponema brennaborense]MCM1470736.1 DNA recombination protein RmuC [Bacteroides sp.]